MEEEGNVCFGDWFCATVGKEVSFGGSTTFESFFFSFCATVVATDFAGWEELAVVEDCSELVVFAGWEELAVVEGWDEYVEEVESADFDEYVEAEDLDE